MLNPEVEGARLVALRDQPELGIERGNGLVECDVASIDCCCC